MEFWRKAKRSSKILRVRNEVIKRRHNNNILEKIKINILNGMDMYCAWEIVDGLSNVDLVAEERNKGEGPK